MLRLLQSNIPPGLAAILALVDTVTIGDAALVVVLARPYPHHRRILGIDYHRADRVRPLRIEHRRPGRAVVSGPPDTAGRGRYEITLGIFGVDRESDYTAGRECRSNGAQMQTAESRGIHGIVRTGAAALRCVFILGTCANCETKRERKYLHKIDLSASL